jgi:VWFA-related protein
LIGNREQKDFRVFEDGKEQEIKRFARQTDLPLTIGLLVDVSGSQERLIDTEKRAAEAFFRQVLRPKDSAFLISFGRDAELLQDFTSSSNLLREGLNQLRLSVSTGGLHPGPVPTIQQPGTILYDAIYLAADEKLKAEVDRKVIVVITDGVDEGSKKTREDAIQAALRADSVIYSILYEDRAAYGGFGGGGGESELRRMSGDTGGRVFRVDRKNTLDDAFRALQDEMRSQYAIAYAPTNNKQDGTFRKIEVRTGNKDDKVQTRKGYYAEPPNN